MVTMDLSYILNELGEDREQWLNAVSPPIFQTSIFCFESVAALREGLRDELETPFYTRGHNPTVTVLRQKMAALEGAEDALVFASGSAAVAAAVIDTVESGDHVVCVRKPYGWTGKLLDQMLPGFGVETSFVDATDTAAVEAAVTERTKLIFLESPNSITFEMQDLQAIAAMARQQGIATICDNSYATPLLQSPIDAGIDMVVHSATKYLNGHSDVVAGVLCAGRDRIRRIFEGPYMTLGGICGPFDAWLLLRGLRTLPVRLERIGRTTQQIIEHLARHPRVKRIYYPQHSEHPQRKLAERQLAGGNGLFSLEIDCRDIAGVERFVDSLERFLIACSWGATSHWSTRWPGCWIPRITRRAGNCPGTWCVFPSGWRNPGS
jgi:cystathionine beta-lyase/cystathionine gamma-synthase